MRVTWVAPSLALEGGSLMGLPLARHLLGIEVDLLTQRAPEDAPTVDGLRVRRVPRTGSRAIDRALLRVASRVPLRGPGLVHALAGTVPRADVISCDRLPAGGAEIRSARAARAVVCPSRVAAEHLMELGVPRERISVIAPGIDLERFRPPSAVERAAARRASGLSPDDFVIAMPGAHPSSAVAEAIGAIAAGATGESLLLAGASDPQAARELATRARVDLGLSDGGERPLCYWAADAMMFPAHGDAFGIPVLEAMACGLPVVVSRGAGASEIVRDAGYVVDAPSVPSLRPALDALRTDPDRRARMGERARELARARGWDEPGRILTDLYERLIGARAARAPQAA